MERTEGLGGAVWDSPAATDLPAGQHRFEVVWDGGDKAGQPVTAGRYRLHAYIEITDGTDPCSQRHGTEGHGLKVIAYNDHLRPQLANEELTSLQAEVVDVVSALNIG